MSQDALKILVKLARAAHIGRVGCISFSNDEAHHYQPCLKELAAADYAQPLETPRGEAVTTSWKVTQKGYDFAKIIQTGPIPPR